MSHVFGKYEKIRRIAQGGMGEVFLARQTGVLDRLAILKSLRADLAQERDFVDQFLDEARVAATLNHPNIVSIFDVGEWNGTYYIAMEYVPGEDLSKLWYAAAKAGVGLPFQVSVRICYEAALGLDHAHKARDVRGNPLLIVHRDVSPQNIMVRGDGVVKLVDFGIAKASNKASRTQAGMVKGKLQYMSPEQVRGEALDGRSDQFSLGVVLWEMCTGRRLFKAENEVQTLNKILQAPMPKPSSHVPGFPAELEATITRMLQREADHRFKSLGEVANELKGYLDRASIASGEISVAGFVQQILGEELEERTRDLTPMEHTEAAAPLPKKPATSARKTEPTRKPTRPPEAARKEEPSAQPEEREEHTAVLPPREDEVDGQVRSTTGVLRFSEVSALHQWILDGLVRGDDTFTLDGRRWQKVKDAKELQKYLQIAAAAQDLRGAPAPGAQPSSVKPVDPAPSSQEVTRPMAAANDPPVAPAEPDAATMRLNLGPADRTDPKTGAFSLGDLPPSHTGTWGAPDLARALQRKDGEARTPTEIIDTNVPRPVTARIPMVAWMLGGVVGALLVVVAALALLAPELLGMVVNGGGSSAPEVQKALTATRADDPAAIDALIGTLSASRRSAAEGDTDAALALLHVARARIDNNARSFKAALGADARRASEEKKPSDDRKPDDDRKPGDGKKPGDDKLPDPERHLVEAYKLAQAARAAQDDAGAALAMAAYQGARGSGAELETEAALALRAKGGADLKRLVADEIQALRALQRGAEAQLSGQPDGLRRAAGPLLKREGDMRAQHAALLLLLLAAAEGGADAKADLERARPLVEGLSQNAAFDRRAADARALLALREKAASAAAVVVDAGVEAPRDAGTRQSAPRDAGPAGVTTPAAAADAGPPPDAGPPETYDNAMDRAQAAMRNGRAGAAHAAYRAALKIKPGDTKAQLGIGWALIDLAKHAPAQEQFQKVIAREPQNADAYMGLGEALRADGKTEDAKAAFQKVLELAPDGPDAEAARNAIRQVE